MINLIQKFRALTRPASARGTSTTSQPSITNAAENDQLLSARPPRSKLLGALSQAGAALGKKSSTLRNTTPGVRQAVEALGLKASGFQRNLRYKSTFDDYGHHLVTDQARAAKGNRSHTFKAPLTTLADACAFLEACERNCSRPGEWEELVGFTKATIGAAGIQTKEGNGLEALTILRTLSQMPYEARRFFGASQIGFEGSNLRTRYPLVYPSIMAFMGRHFGVEELDGVAKALILCGGNDSKTQPAFSGSVKTMGDLFAAFDATTAGGDAARELSAHSDPLFVLRQLADMTPAQRALAVQGIGRLFAATAYLPPTTLLVFNKHRGQAGQWSEAIEEAIATRRTVVLGGWTEDGSRPLAPEAVLQLLEEILDSMRPPSYATT